MAPYIYIVTLILSTLALVGPSIAKEATIVAVQVDPLRFSYDSETGQRTPVLVIAIGKLPKDERAAIQRYTTVGIVYVPMSPGIWRAALWPYVATQEPGVVNGAVREGGREILPTALRTLSDADLSTIELIAFYETGGEETHITLVPGTTLDQAERLAGTIFEAVEH